MATFWQLAGFAEALERWLDLEDPPAEVRLAVAHWPPELADEAYAGARRHTKIAVNLWTRAVPGTLHNGRLVYAAYWIEEDIRTVRANLIATLNSPVV